MKKPEIIRNIVIVLSSVGLIATGGVFVSRSAQAKRAQNTQEQTMELYHPPEQPPEDTTIDEPVATEAPVEPEGFVDVETENGTIRIHQDFLELFGQNPDFVGWLKAGQTIDYPIVQKKDSNEYYLNYDFFGKSDSNGTIFLNKDNNLVPRDDLLMLHGHNMPSGSMFGRLRDYESYNFLCEYPVISFRTIYDAKDVYYTPLACFNASMIENEVGYFKVGTFVFDKDNSGLNNEIQSDQSYGEYLDEITGRSLWQSKVDVTEDDRLLALVTCSYQHTDGRFLLFCRELRENETPEDVKGLYLTNTNE